jgi:hypothetical protein
LEPNHKVACAWRFVPELETFNDPPDAPTHANWVSEMMSEGEQADPVALYIHSAFYAVHVMGFGVPPRSKPTTEAERFFSVFAILLGGSLFVYYVGCVAALLTNMDPARHEYNTIMDHLNAYVLEINLPKKERSRLRLFMVRSELNFRDKWYQNMLGYLSPELQIHVMKHR